MSDVNETELADTTEVVSEAGFSDGDLGRVQALLFGDHARHTMERVDTLEQALLGAISDLRAEMQNHVADLERRITAESENRTTSVSNVGDRLTEEVKTLSKADRALERDLTKTSEKLTAAIDTSSTKAREALAKTRKELSDEIERAHSALRESNVDRGALAGMMAAVAEQLADEK